MVNKIKIEVAYALPEKQKLFSLEIPAGSTIEFAIKRSGVLEEFPDIDLSKQKVGIFSKARNLLDHVVEGDRIEIYRPLTIDPKVARKNRAAAKPIKKK